MTTDESYTLTIKPASNDNDNDRVDVIIESHNFFGSRHGLETLSQLIFYDDVRDEMQLPRDVRIVNDRPVYAHRGLLLDTARNFIDVPAIKRTLDGMGAAKLNVLHWHITDSHSFPYQSPTRPELSVLGRYEASKVYTPQDVADLVEYARERGVKIVPEFDAPAHVGEGWQDTDFVACFDKKPWQDYCVEPPCGQFDPTKDELYDVLEDIYGDMLAQFAPDIFHMGGDEVSFNCWNTTDTITSWMTTNGYERTEEGFVRLWVKFQREALKRLDRKSVAASAAAAAADDNDAEGRGNKLLPVILWTSTLTKTKGLTQHLPPDRYVIQIWTRGTDDEIEKLLKEGYRLIISNYDALYLDCGFAGWVTGGNNWCSPYIGWQKVYTNSPAKIAGKYKDQILGAEAALWTEQVDSATVDGRLWPRASALAERLWAEPPPTSTWHDAEQRLLAHRERLVTRGIAADALEPQWCLMHEGNCPTHGEFNGGI